MSADIHIFKVEGNARVQQSEVNRAYFDAITHYTREKDTDSEGWWIKLHHASGGMTCVLTMAPLVLVEPERQ